MGVGNKEATLPRMRRAELVGIKARPLCIVPRAGQVCKYGCDGGGLCDAALLVEIAQRGHVFHKDVSRVSRPRIRRRNSRQRPLREPERPARNPAVLRS
jgi:hypothetical protein